MIKLPCLNIKKLSFKRQSFFAIVLIIAILLNSISPALVLAQEATPSATPTQDSASTPTVSPILSPTASATSASATPVQQSSSTPASFSSPSPTQGLSFPISDLFISPTVTPISSPTPTLQVISTLTNSPEAMESGKIRLPIKIIPLPKRYYLANESVIAQLINNKDPNIKVSLLYAGKEEVLVPIDKEIVGEETVLRISPGASFKPGKYTLKVIDSNGDESVQDFLWGVLAINTNKSIYLPNEKAKLAFAVLDEQGMMICDAKLKLTIKENSQNINDELTTENGKIIVNPECKIHDFTLNPDYEGEYQVGGVGTYEMTLTAETKNGTYTISDSFEVKESVPFDVERTTATRIYPPKTYPMTFHITAFEDFAGKIEEVVPKDFQIFPAINSRSYDEIKEQGKEKIITWNVSGKKGQKLTLGYYFKAPDISPQFYLLGPLKIGDFREARQWQIAADATATRTKTVEFYIGQNYSTSGIASGTVATYDFTVYLPDAISSASVIRSAYIEYNTIISATSATATAFQLGVVGSLTTLSSPAVINQSGESQPVQMKLDATAKLQSIIQAAGTFNLRFTTSITGPVRYGENARLLITYDYDDQAATQVKTVYAWVHSQAATVASGGTVTSANFNLGLPESNITSQSTFIETRGYVNAALTTGFYWNAETERDIAWLNTTNSYGYVALVSPTTTYNPNTNNTFTIKSVSGAFSAPSAILHYTYSFNYSASTELMNSLKVLLYQGTETASTTTLSGNKIINLPETGITMKSCFLQGRAVNSNTATMTLGINAQLGSTPTTTGINFLANASETSGFRTIVWDVTSNLSTMAAGDNTVYWAYSTSASTNIRGLTLYLNYKYNKTSTRYNSQAEFFVGQQTAASTTWSQAFTPSIADSNYTLKSSHLNAQFNTNATTATTYTVGITTTAGYAFLTTGEDTMGEVWRDTSSDVTSLGSSLTATLNGSNSTTKSASFLVWWQTTAPPAINQAAYRWFENNNGTSVVTPLADQDMAINVPAQGTAFRLRILLDVDQRDLAAAGQSFTLQYAVKSGSCDSDFVGETYVDVSDSSGDIRFYNNSTPNDGDTVTANATYDPTYLGHTKVMERYEEVNPTNNVNAIPNGQSGLWDFSLVNYSAPAGTAYCFRVKKDSSYTVNPQTAKAVSGLGTTGSLNYGTWDGTSYWIGNYNDHTLHKISPAGTVTTYALASNILPIQLAWDGTYIWVASADTYGTLVKFDPSTGQTVGTWQKNPTGLGSGGIQGVRWDGTNLWIGVAQNGGGTGSGFVAKLNPTDPSTNLCTATDITNAGGMTLTSTDVWAVRVNDVVKIAKSDCSKTQYTGSGTTPTHPDNDGTYIYLPNFGSYNITKMRMSDGTVVGTYPTCRGSNIARFDGSNAHLWVACDDGRITVHDPSTMAIIGDLVPAAVNNKMNGLAFDGDYMWVAGFSNSYVYKMNTGQMLNTYTKIPEISPTAIEQYAYHWSNDDGGEIHWYDLNWNYRKKITIQKTKVSGSLTNFPVLVSLTTDSDLASHARTDGYDILFTSATQAKIPYERETYNNSTGQLVAWVKVPALSSSADTVIYLYYGNAGAADQQDATNVWDDNYKMVQHLSDLTTSTTKDSKNSNNGTKYAANSPIETTDAKIWRAQSFNGTTDFINTGNDPTLQISSAITVEGWFKSSVANDNWDKIASKGNSVWSLEAKDDQGHYGFTVYDSTWNTARAGTYTTGVWNYVVGTYSTSDHTIRAYVNGVLGTTATATQITNYNAYNLYLGAIPDASGNYVNGIIDEVRVSNVVRSADWIATSYNTMNDPASFYSLGAEESRATISPATWKAAENTAVSNQAKGTNVRVRFALANTGGSASYNYRLQVGQLVGATCDTDETYTDVPTTTSGCGTAVACMTTSPNFADGAATTNQSSAKGTFTAGKMIEDPSNQTSSLALNQGYYTEVEYNFQFTSFAANSTTYCFRTTNAGSATSFTYTKVATITTESGGVVGPTLDQLLRHGAWFNSSGVKQPFTF